jgi:uncharacterized protein YhaN
VRIARLRLERYGHLSDVDLAFPTTPGMHIVLGANEAGKSTALAAIGDALFRFPTRTPFAFAHGPRDLRLGIELHARDGRVGRFVRRKGNRDDLLDENGVALPESAIAAFLSGASRERFQHLFGLDAAALRSGGQAILEGRGEVGESLLQAHTGLHGFRALVDKLGEEAGRLFGDRRGRRDLHVAVERFKEAQRARDERTVEPAAYKAAREAQDALEASRATLAHEAEHLRTDRARLDRIRRTSPARLAMVRARAEREALGEVPALPPDAETRRLDAVIARERAAHDLAAIRERGEALAAGLAGLEIDERLLAEAEAIDALAADRSRIAGATRDRAELRIVAEQHQAALGQAVGRLGLAADVSSIASRIPSAMARDAAERAIVAHARLSERQTAAAAALEEARALHDAALARLAALPDPAPVDDLRDAIERARAEGRIDAERDAAIRAETEAAAERDRLLAALPLWPGTAEALAVAKLPLETMVNERAATLDQAEQAARAARDTLAAHDGSLAALDADLRDLTASGELPTPQAIAAIRTQRDRAWRLIRRHRLEGGAAPAEEELAGLGAADALPDRFEQLLGEADALVDRGEAERTRVARFATLSANQARERTAREAAAEACGLAEITLETARAGWQALWREADIAPLAPPAMREWRARREAVIAQGQRHAEAARRRAEIAARHAVAMASLAAVLAAPEAGTVAPLLAAAERVLATREAAVRTRREALAATESSLANLERATRALAKADAEMAEWALGWRGAAEALGLPADTNPEAGKIALALWRDVEALYRDWRNATDRIAQMTQTIAAFTAEAAAIARRAAPGLADLDVHDAVRALASGLATCRAAAAERDKLTAERERLEEAAAHATAKLQAAHADLATLHTLAHTATDAELQDAIARAARHAALSAEIGAREAELHRLDDGKSLAELAIEAEGADLDALPSRIADIDERLRAIGTETTETADRLAELRHALSAMQQGHDAAGAAQEMEDALAEIDDIAGRYVRTRLAHTLLRAGIDRFRRQQQAPLLSRAGALFARLTEDRYHALGVEEDDGKLAIVAERPDRSTCPADRLSEGTRDQLYLALRLAAIESYAAKTEPLPFIADDLLVNFDDRRARAALRVLGEMGAQTQVILFTHHAHIVEMADPALASLHRLGAAETLPA